MVYKKYIKRGGKIYGPYIYRSRKENGKVITEYLGTHKEHKKNSSRKNNKKVLKNFSVILALVSFFVLISFMTFNFTGKVSLDIENEYLPGEQITGNLELSLKSGELIPASTKLLIDNSGEISEYFLSDLFLGDFIEGDFYVEDKNISGQGQGFGIIGEKKIYPEVFFELELLDGTIIEASCFFENDFVYDLLENSTISIVKNSVEVDGKKITDENINLEIVDGQVVVSTEYYESVLGFGEEFLTDEISKLVIDLSKFNLISQEGVLMISLVYDDTLKGTSEELASVSKVINIEEPLTNETEVVEPETPTQTEEIVEEVVEPEINITELVENKNLSHYKAIIGRPVKWVKPVDLNEETIIELPKNSKNISIKTGQEVIDSLNELNEYKDVIRELDREDLFEGGITGMVSLDIKNHEGFLTRFFNWFSSFSFTGNVILEEDIQEKITETENSKKVDLQEIVNVSEEMILIEYYTDAPVAVESPLGDDPGGPENLKGKRITISDENEFGYENILAYTSLEGFPEDKINLNHIVNGSEVKVDFTSYDFDEDGLVDYIEWIVPHLSEQVYEIIYITNAVHLDSNKTFISDIYDEVKQQDGIWSETINNNEYVRVTFEQELSSKRDITIYARAFNESSSVEVYAENSEELITTFENVDEENRYKVYLTNLNGIEDTFDLKINGSVEFDYIVDPIIALDSDGGQYNGTLSAGVTYQEVGKIGTAFNFSGEKSSEDAVTSDIDMTGYSAFSFAVWIKADVMEDMRGQIISSKYSSSDDLRFGMTTNSRIAVSYDDGTFNSILSVVPPIKTWFHAVFIHNGTNALYLNGSYINGTTDSFNWAGLDGITTFGARSVTDTYGFNGTLDELGIWGRALTSAEVAEIYNSGSGLSYDSFDAGLKTDLDLYYKFDDDCGVADGGGCSDGNDCCSNFCINAVCRAAGSCSSYEGYGCSDDATAWNNAAAGTCLTDGTCFDGGGGAIVTNCGASCSLGTGENVYWSCENYGGDACDTDAGGNFVQNGMCYDDGAAGYACATDNDWGIFYDGSNYKDDTQVATTDYDWDEDSSGKSCDNAITSGGDYDTIAYMVVSTGCETGEIRVDDSDNNYFVDGCDASSGDMCDNAIAAHLTVPWVQSGICADSTCDGTDVAEVGSNYQACGSAEDGYACETTPTSGTFSQDSMCLSDSDDGGSWDCKTSGHACNDGTYYEDTCASCAVTDDCTSTLDSGDYAASGICISDNSCDETDEVAKDCNYEEADCSNYYADCDEVADNDRCDQDSTDGSYSEDGVCSSNTCTATTAENTGAGNCADGIDNDGDGGCDNSGGCTGVATKEDDCDGVPPAISITVPINSSNYSSAIIESINYTYSDAGVGMESCWFSNDTGTTNNTITCGTNLTNVGWEEGANVVWIFANDTAGNINTSESITFTVDTTNPAISIPYPFNGTYFPTATVDVNYTFTEANPSYCFWSNDTWATNNTLASCGTNATGDWDEGLNTVWIGMNDTLGWVNNTESISFYVDTINPALSITTPINSSNYTYTTGIYINYTYNDTNTQNCFWSNDTWVTNTTITCGTNLTTQTWEQGLNTIWIGHNDSFGRVNNSESITFTVDTINPAVAMVIPGNATNWSTKTVQVNTTMIDTNLQTCWYSNDSWATNNTFTCGTNLTGDWEEGENIIYFAANDSFGNINTTTQITFTIDTIAPVFGNVRNFTHLVNTSFSESFSATDSGLGIQKYFLNDTTNFIINNSGLITNNSPLIATFIHYLNVSVNDTVNNTNSVEIFINITADEVPPNITIFSPEEITYESSSVSFETEINEQGYCMFSTDSGASNLTMTTSDNLTFSESNAFSNGGYTASFYCNDTAGNWNITESVAFTVNAPDPPVSSGGGGGPTASRSVGFTLDKESFETSLTLNNVKYGEIRINNGEDYQKTFDISTTLEDIIVLKEETITVKEGGLYDIKFDVLAPAEVGIYTGKIVVSSGATVKNVFVTVNVNSDKSLFDLTVDIPPQLKILDSGDGLSIQIGLIQAGVKEKMDVTLNYEIKDFEQKIYFEESEDIEIYGQQTISKEFNTIDLITGNYVLGVELIYPDGIAVASSQFKIKGGFTFTRDQLLLMIIIGMVTVALVVMVKSYRSLGRRVARSGL